jgi:outer membrane protein assembly factor BamE (lipoprotein component of BamABCDE complex)
MHLNILRRISIKIGMGLACCGLVLFATGCASVGHDFNHDAAANLELGRLQKSDCYAKFGEHPQATSEKTTVDGHFETIRYVHAFADMGSAKARVLVLEFKNGTLNAFIYLSSFDEHQGSLLSDKLGSIAPHVSTKDNVLTLLGKPNGKALCPTTLADFKENCDKCVEVWKWASMTSVSTFGAAYGGKKPSTASISVGFDHNGVVTDITTASENQK